MLYLNEEDLLIGLSLEAGGVLRLQLNSFQSRGQLVLKGHMENSC